MFANISLEKSLNFLKMGNMDKKKEKVFLILRLLKMDSQQYIYVKQRQYQYTIRF